MGGVGKFKEKNAVLARICMNLKKEFGVICGGRGIFFPKIVVRGVKIVGNRVAIFRKMVLSGGLKFGRGEYITKGLVI